jgi:hypothetical protein
MTDNRMRDSGVSGLRGAAPAVLSEKVLCGLGSLT